MSQAAVTSTTFNRLTFNGVAFNDLADGVKPNFQCPICQYTWQPKLDLGNTFSATFDYNQKATFTIPTHTDPSTAQQCNASNQKIDLFIAIHKDTAGTRMIIQRSDSEGTNGINSNWWINHDATV